MWLGRWQAVKYGHSAKAGRLLTIKHQPSPRERERERETEREREEERERKREGEREKERERERESGKEEERAHIRTPRLVRLVGAILLVGQHIAIKPEHEYVKMCTY
jgi:hypothetical protein